MTGSWAFILTDPAGAILSDMRIAPTLRFELDGDWTCRFKLGYGDTGVDRFYEALGTCIPRLLAYRDGTLWFAGGLDPFEEDSDDDAQEIEVQFRAPPAWPLDYRIEDYYNLAPTDAGLIAWNLVSRQAALSALPFTMPSSGSIPSTTTRTKVFVRSNVWQAIRDMTGVQIENGFDLKVTPRHPGAYGGSLALVEIVASLGSDLSGSVKFEHGPGTLDNCLSVTRQWQLPANRVTCTVNHAYTGDPVAATVQDAGSIATYGLFAVSQEEPEAQDDADLTDRATRLLRPSPTQSVTFQPDLNAPSVPQPGAHYWLGDTVSFRAARDHLQIETAERVTAIEIEVDTSMNEVAHRLEYGPRKPTMGRLIGQLAQRVYWLERP